MGKLDLATDFVEQSVIRTTNKFISDNKRHSIILITRILLNMHDQTTQGVEVLIKQRAKTINQGNLESKELMSFWQRSRSGFK
jgi:hypothetical protein